jgi:hypothetical protein
MLQVVKVTNLPEVIDGYGNPFPEEKQLLHWQYIKAAIERAELDKQLPTPHQPECEPKLKPAGHYSREGSGI